MLRGLSCCPRLLSPHARCGSASRRASRTTNGEVQPAATQTLEVRTLLSGGAATIAGVASTDWNGDDRISPGDPIEAGVRVALYEVGTDGEARTPDDAVVGRTQTDADGRYEFTVTQPGRYHLWVEPHRWGGYAQPGVGDEMGDSDVDRMGSSEVVAITVGDLAAGASVAWDILGRDVVDHDAAHRLGSRVGWHQTEPSGPTDMTPDGRYLLVGSVRWDTLTGERIEATTVGGRTLGGFTGLSDDGRIAVLATTTDYVADDTNGEPDVYVYDFDQRALRRVSVASDGTQGNGSSTQPKLSGDGRVVTFMSSASNLVEGDDNEDSDVFVHHLDTGQTARASVHSDGTGGDRGSLFGSISDDGRTVAFFSYATNLTSDGLHGWSLYLHDTQTGQTTTLGHSRPDLRPNGTSYRPSLSREGRYVSFESRASNLVAGDTNGETDIFRLDRQTGEIVRLNVFDDGRESAALSWASTISADGDAVVFQSRDLELVGDGAESGDTLYLVRVSTGQITRVAVDEVGNPVDGVHGSAKLTERGETVVFSRATGVFPSELAVYSPTSGTAEKVVWPHQPHPDYWTD